MRFYCLPLTQETSISLIQDGDDVNICVNGEIVAWFGSDDNGDGVLCYNESWLKEAGLRIEGDDK